MKKGLIETGQIVNTHGIRGELKIQSWADSPGFLAGLSRLYIDGNPVQVLSARVHKGNVIALLDGVHDIDSAIRMKNKKVFIEREDVPLEEGQFFIADLVGLSALDSETGENLGVVSEVLSRPAHNVYIIKGTREILIPAVPEFIDEINIDSGYIKLRMMEGL